MSEQELLNRIKELEEENKNLQTTLNIKDELLFGLEVAESFLEDDIQEIAYIQEDLLEIKNGKDVLNIFEVTNRLEILLKSMLYNKDGIKSTISRAYKEKRVAKEGVA